MKKSKLLMPLAGIAAIGAVAPIVTLASCNKGAFVNEADKEFLTKINGYMKYGNQYVAPHKAITALKDLGLDVLSFKLSNKTSEFAFDVNVKKFIIMNGDSIAAAPEDYKMEDAGLVFKFTNNYNKDSKYGQYLLDNYNWTTPATAFEVKTSIDVGNNFNIKNMKYIGDANNEKKVLLRTYCENLTVQAQKDTVIHAGESNNIDINYKCQNKCNYTELGKVAYMYVENAKLNIAQIDTSDAAQIDVVEPGKNVTAGDKFHKELVTMFVQDENKYKIEGADVTYDTIVSVGTLDKLIAAIDDATVSFIRLTDNIEIGTVGAKALTIDSRSFVLDLAGFTITDKSDVAKGKALIDVQAKTKNTLLMFIDSERSGALVLNDHYINVCGNTNSSGKIASLYLEGANITYNATTERNGAIMVGHTVATSLGRQYSRVHMFGGVIKANTESTSHKIEASGIYANNDSYVQVIYGSIYSSTNCVRTSGAQSYNAYIDLYQPTFALLNKDFGECIYLAAGKLNIWGGTYEGHTCIGIRGGHTNIAGGYFHATGKAKNIEAQTTEGSPSGIEGDGSVICVALCDTDTTYKGGYGKNPSLTVANATLYSDESYILQVFRDSITTEDINQFFEADFFDGVYYYGSEVSVPEFNGVRMANVIYEQETKQQKSLYRISQQGGSWINIKK